MSSVLSLGALAGLLGACDDPGSAKYWVKRLDDPREVKEAVRQLVKLKDKDAVEPLMKLYKKTRDPEQLRARHQ